MPEEAKKRVRPAEDFTNANPFFVLQGLHPPDPPDPPDPISPSLNLEWDLPSPEPLKRTVRFKLPSQINSITKPVVHRLIKLDGTLAGKPARFLLDSGASHSYVSKKFVTDHSLSITTKDDDSSVRLSVTLADGTINPSDGSLESVPVRISSYADNLDFAVTDLSKAYDAILGMSWLYRFNPTIDWRAGTISFVHGTSSHVLQPSSSSPSLKQSAASLNLISGKQL